MLENWKTVARRARRERLITLAHNVAFWGIIGGCAVYLVWGSYRGVL